MKNKILSMLLALVFVITLLPSSVVFADDYGMCGDNLYWEITAGGYLLHIYGYGEMYDYSRTNPPPWEEWKDWVTEIEITGECITGEITDENLWGKVVNIGNNAFADFVNLDCVHIYNDLSCESFHIGNSAFSGCENLREIYFSNEYDAVDYIGDSAFESCSYFGSSYDIAEMLRFSNNFNYLGVSAFANCGSLTYVNIPDSLTTISEYSFSGSGVQTVILGENTKEINRSAFQYCLNLKQIKLNKNLTEIKEMAFSLCEDLSLVYYEGDTGGLNSIMIDFGNEAIEENLKFDGVYDGACGDNATWKFENNILTLYGTGQINDYYPYTSTPWFVFSEDVTEIVIDEGIENIVNSCFSGFLNVNRVTIPDTVITIGGNAFKGCADLENIILPENLKAIKSNTFNDCVKLKNVTLPETLETIGESAFSGCSSLSKIIIPSKVTTVDRYAFENAGLEVVYINGQIDKINNATFRNCNKLNTIVLPASISQIENYAFYKCNSLANVYYADTLEKWSSVIIGKYNDPLQNATFISEYKSVSITDFTLSEYELLLPIGYSKQLSVNVLPEEAKMKVVKWSSSDKSVAMVDSWGNVTGMAEGTAVIIAEDETGSFMEFCMVEVFTPILVNKIELSESQLELIEKESKTITASITPDNVTNKKLIWISSNENVATVDNGVVKAIAEGETIITVTSEDGNASAICSIVVQKLYPLTGIKFDNTKLTLNAGDSYTMNVTYIPENASPKNLNWSSSNPNVATVDNGIVKALRAGTTTITATTEIGGYSDICEIVVVPTDNPDIEIDKSELIIANGTCGDNLIWTLDSEGLLVISGTGELGPFEYGSEPSYIDYVDEIKSVVVESGVKSVGISAFRLHPEKIELPDTLEEIKSFAFMSCNVNEIVIPGSVQTIEDYAFVESHIQKIVICEGVKSIGNWIAAEGNVRNITIPRSVTSIGDDLVSGYDNIIYYVYRDSYAYEMLSYTGSCILLDDDHIIEKISDPYVTVDDSSSELIATISCPDKNAILYYSFNGENPARNGILYKKPFTITDTDKLRIIATGTGMASSNIVSYNYAENGAGTIFANEINLSESDVIMTVGDSKTIIPIILPENTTNKNLIWASNNDSIATVKNGVITAISEGEAIVTVTSEDGNASASCFVTVNNFYPLTGIQFDKSKHTLNAGESYTLNVTYIPENASPKNLNWSSSNPNVATVDNGIVKALRAGTTTVVATSEYGAYTATCEVTVLPVSVSGVALDKSNMCLTLGETDTLTATIIPNVAENKKVVWKSHNENIVSVDNGTIKAKGIGTTTITVTTEEGKYTASCEVTVLPVSVTEIRLDKAELNIKVGTTGSIKTTIIPENATDQTVLWSSNDETIATVENGIVTGVGIGTTVVVAKTKDGDYRGYCAVTVSAAYVSVTEITLDISKTSLVEGQSKTLTVTVKPDNATNKNIIWSSNNEAVATVDNGKVTAVAPGTAVIIATTEDGGHIATCIVTVSSVNQEVVSAPIASVLSGIVKENTSVILLSATKNAEIYYTLDGTAPSRQSTKYTSPITITAKTKIKAIAIKSGMQDSNIATFNYTLADPEIPYVNVLTNITGNKSDITTVSVNTTENSGMAGGSFNLIYDNTAVELISVSVGNIISNANPIVNDKYGQNKIRVTWAGIRECNAGGELINVQFKILDTDKEVIYFNLEKVKMADGNSNKITVQSNDGVLTLREATLATNHEYSTQSIINSDQMSVTVNVTSNSKQNACLLVATYDDKGKLIQLKKTDITNVDLTYTVDLEKMISDTDKVKVFVWSSLSSPKPLSAVELISR